MHGGGRSGWEEIGTGVKHCPSYLHLSSFRHVAQFQKVVSRIFLSSFFFLSFLSIRIICIRMLHLFQRAESIYERQAGLSLSSSTHFYLVCVQTTNEARCKIKMCDAFLSQKQSVQAEALLSHKKQQSLVNTELLKIMTKIILNLQTNQKHFCRFCDYDISKSNE